METSSASKRRRTEERVISICELPEDVLLVVFSFLDVLSVVRCSLTCRQWYRISKDWSLWQQVDLTMFTLQSQALRKFVQQYCSDKTKV
jgi:hypothetical protein